MPLFFYGFLGNKKNLVACRLAVSCLPNILLNEKKNSIFLAVIYTKQKWLQHMAVTQKTDFNKWHTSVNKKIQKKKTPSSTASSVYVANHVHVHVPTSVTLFLVLRFVNEIRCALGLVPHLHVHIKLRN